MIIDPPVGPFSSEQAITAWILELEERLLATSQKRDQKAIEGALDQAQRWLAIKKKLG